MVTQSLRGPWLNLEELTQKTGLVKNEILYAIQTQYIKPVIYTGNRSFLAYSTNSKGQRIGHSHFQYSGTLAIHSQAIQEIVSDDQTILGFEPVELLSPEHIKTHSSHYPFKDALPNSLLHAWQHNDNPFADGVSIMPLPYEYPDYGSAESVIVEYIPDYCCEDTYLANHADRFFVREPTSNVVYGAYETHIFCQHDLRFPKATVQRLLDQENKPETPINNISKNLDKKRTNDLHKVIARLLSQHSSAQVGTLWNTLRRDIQQVNREYDNDHVITQMSHAEIHWVSSTGTQKTLKKNSFKTRISQLRKVGI